MDLGSYYELNSTSGSEEDEESPKETKTSEVQKFHERIKPNGKYIDAVSI